MINAGGSGQSQQVTVGGGHAGGVALPLHFGIGRAETAQVTVRWPDGTTSAPITARAGETAVIVQAD